EPFGVALVLEDGCRPERRIAARDPFGTDEREDRRVGGDDGAAGGGSERRRDRVRSQPPDAPRLDEAAARVAAVDASAIRTLQVDADAGGLAVDVHDEQIARERVVVTI